MIHSIHTGSYMPPLKVYGKDLEYWRGQECGGNGAWHFRCAHCKSLAAIPASIVGLPDGSNPKRWIGECSHCGGMLDIETHEI